VEANMTGRNNGPSGGPLRRWRTRRVRRVTGCLLWLATILLVLLVLSILFGGFQRGSKVGGSGRVHAVPAVVSRDGPA
jgi:hypothetical protein